MDIWAQSISKYGHFWLQKTKMAMAKMQTCGFKIWHRTFFLSTAHLALLVFNISTLYYSYFSIVKYLSGWQTHLKNVIQKSSPLLRRIYQSDKRIFTHWWDTDGVSMECTPVIMCAHRSACMFAYKKHLFNAILAIWSQELMQEGIRHLNNNHRIMWDLTPLWNLSQLSTAIKETCSVKPHSFSVFHHLQWWLTGAGWPTQY